MWTFLLATCVGLATFFALLIGDDNVEVDLERLRGGGSPIIVPKEHNENPFENYPFEVFPYKVA